MFIDTKWESEKTYDYLKYMEDFFKKEIIRVTSIGMENMILRERAFPSSRMRFCTRILKKEPFDLFISDYSRNHPHEDICIAVGIRRDESQDRKDAKVFEEEPETGNFYWRPIVMWSVEDVINIHKKHSMKLNPLYYDGSSRVGCYPCIYSNKNQIRAIALNDPSRIDLIEDLESKVSEFRGKPVSFFKSKDKMQHPGIRDVVEWSMHDRKGLPIIDSPSMQGGCGVWGFCEAPSKED